MTAAGLASLTAVGPADRAGRLLLGLAAAALAAVAVRDLLCRPVLSADGTGLRLQTGWRPRAVPWSDVVSIRLVTERRTRVLAVDGGSWLVLLSRHRLDAAPAAVRDVLSGYAPDKVR
ncbi:MAG: PH domain-containing protein [Actinomycetota bacterium]|nr:PH domain-containing protein [Actinomycetota bacterium]